MKKRILLADDDPGIREMLGRVLESEQYEVVLAGTGREAVAKFAAHLPDLILLDLNMPDLDGWEAIDRITRYPSFCVRHRHHREAKAIRTGCGNVH